MTDWYDRVEREEGRYYVNEIGYHGSNVDSRAHPEGSVFFRRRRGRRFRTRYIVCVSNKWGQLQITNTEVRYRKSKKAWGIFIADEVVAHYRTLRSAKLALMPGVLDRMGAEGDRCLDPPYSEQSSKSEASAH